MTFTHHHMTFTEHKTVPHVYIRPSFVNCCLSWLGFLAALEPLPADVGQRQEDTLDRSPIHYRTRHSLPVAVSESLVSLRVDTNHIQGNLWKL